MKRQIKRLSPHQNGKVIGVLMAVSSLVMIIPMFLIMLGVPRVEQQGSPAGFPYFMLAIFPVFYLVFGYLAGVIGSAVYNVLFRYVGGFEFELARDPDGE